MNHAHFATLLLTLPLCACSNGGDTAQDVGSAPAHGEPVADVDPLTALRENVAATAAREERDVANVKVAHILVAFKGAERASVTRSKEEAEQRAAELLARVAAGEDFLALMRASSDDSGGGVYGMTMGGGPSGYFPRQGMATAFGDIGWRLDVNEVGVAAFDPIESPFGWHIIKRLE